MRYFIGKIHYLLLGETECYFILAKDDEDALEKLQSELAVMNYEITLEEIYERPVDGLFFIGATGS